jgi:acetolactate synthase I/II/III large subunit
VPRVSEWEQDPDAQHGGRLVARALRAAGVRTLFTLSGGHLFSIYDGCRELGIELVDTRHEQTAAFAAEGWSKVTRELGACALTAGPGVTNGMSAIGSASENHSPMLVLGGRAPEFRWGQGSLQEIDHVPFVAPLTRMAATARQTADIPRLMGEAAAAAIRPHGGPAFLDFPLDSVFGAADVPDDAFVAPPRPWEEAGAPAADLSAAAAALAAAERPVIMAGTDLYWGRAENELVALAETLSIPVFLNGLGRGCVPADHPLAFSRARSRGLGEADVALVIGVPLDFRLGFGAAFAEGATVIGIDTAAGEREPPRPFDHRLIGALPATLAGLLAEAGGSGSGSGSGSGGDSGSGSGGDVRRAREAWVASLRELEDERRAAEAADLADDRAPLHPMRIYGELRTLLDRDAIVIGDGGDFVSYAGRVVDSYQPGCWVDPGPFGCLGSGPGYALAAKLAFPHRQVVLLLGDGAFGFSGMEWDTLARHGVAVVGIVGNNGIWALEKHPMEAMYGYSVVADLRPGTRYDEVVGALGGHGELVTAPGELRGAIERALGCGGPALVNVLTDPGIAYPRRSNLG